MGRTIWKNWDCTKSCHYIPGGKMRINLFGLPGDSKIAGIYPKHLNDEPKQIEG